MRKSGEKAPNQRKASRSFPPLCRYVADPHVHTACAVASLSCFRGNYRATKEESHATERNKDCCSPFTPPPLHHFWIIKSGTAIPRLEIQSIVTAIQMFAVHLLFDCQNTWDQVCQLDTGEMPLPWRAYHSIRSNSYGKSMMQWTRWGSNVRSQSSAAMLSHERAKHKSSELLLLIQLEVPGPPLTSPTLPIWKCPYSFPSF